MIRGKVTFIKAAVIILGFLLLIGLNIAQKMESQNLVARTQVLEKTNEELKSKASDQKDKISKLEKENKKMLATQLVDKNSDVYQSFSEVTTKYFKSRFNYDPKTYEESKEKVKSLISKDLYDEFFGNKLTYGDSINVSSRLSNLEVYSGSVVDQKFIIGVLLVDYENKLEDMDWSKNSEIYNVQYDITTKKLTKIQSLGSVLRGDMIE